MVRMNHLASSATLLAGVAVAATTGHRCRDITVPVTLAAQNVVFDGIEPLKTRTEVTNFILGLMSTPQSSSSSAAAATPLTNVTGTYELAATYCAPANGSRVLQVLTHGIGFDRGYWDFALDGHRNYSYVDFALDHGYATLSWDRLGTGASSHGDPVREIQAPLEIAALRSLTASARDGTLPLLPSGLGNKTTAGFEKVVHVGHSFGSGLTHSFAALYPADTDGVVLTGYTHSMDIGSLASLALHFAPASAVPATCGYPDGYLAVGDLTAAHYVFFAPGQFDPAMLEAAYAAAQPVAVAEMLTFPTGAYSTVNTTGPVLVVTGEHDLVFCAANCFATGDPDVESLTDLSKQYYPLASPFKSVTIEGAGHGLNLEYTWPITYSTIIDFLVQNGLAP